MIMMMRQQLTRYNAISLLLLLFAVLNNSSAKVHGWLAPSKQHHRQQFGWNDRCNRPRKRHTVSDRSSLLSKSLAIQTSFTRVTSHSKRQRLLASIGTPTAPKKGNIIRRSLKRIKESITSQDRTREELKIGIAGFYDRSSLLWENVWGEHMHHGYYIPANRTDHQQAQIDLIDEVLKWANVTGARKVVDVGCGIGGSSRHIARKYNCTTEGITLSPYQANRGNELATEQQLSNQCNFQVADALEMPFANNSFDLIWSLESGEHMPDKQQFVSELFRVTEPGGKIIIVTWCHRDLNEGESSLTKSELRLLRRINRAYYLPQWCSVQDYVNILSDMGGQNIQREDWSYIIAPFWKAVIRSSLNLKSIIGLLQSGFSTQRGAYAMFLMLSGFNKGLIKFGLLTCTKPL